MKRKASDTLRHQDRTEVRRSGECCPEPNDGGAYAFKACVWASPIDRRFDLLAGEYDGLVQFVNLAQIPHAFRAAAANLSSAHDVAFRFRTRFSPVRLFERAQVHLPRGRGMK